MGSRTQKPLADEYAACPLARAVWLFSRDGNSGGGAIASRQMHRDGRVILSKTPEVFACPPSLWWGNFGSLTVLGGR